MIWLTLFTVFVITTIASMLIGNIHGYIGATILGLNTVFFDLFWQWIRFKIVRKNKTSYLVGGILGGLVVRVISVLLFIEFGLWWLGKGSNYFIAFAALLLTIPLWSLIAGYKFKLEKPNNGNLP